MESERRSSNRCPVCQGPMKEVADGSGLLRCRSSLCRHNHRNEACPRCQHLGPVVSERKGTEYRYSCPECMHSWSKESA